MSRLRRWARAVRAEAFGGSDNEQDGGVLNVC